MTDTPDIVDIHVGRAIRARRRELVISQEKLAEAIGVSFQQVQKYENAANRVSCSMLMRICATLKCGPQDLLPSAPSGPSTARGDTAALRLMGERGGVELAEVWLGMSPKSRSAMLLVGAALMEPHEPPPRAAAAPTLAAVNA